MREKAIIAGININNQSDFENSMEELKNLAYACGIEVVGEVTQRLERINKAHYFGKGKITEVKGLLGAVKGDMVIFNDELSPTQIRNLEELLRCRVIDRTVLILDIFAGRARTREAQLQVEIAMLQYRLPRLSGRGESMSRQRGGAGTINRGSGETKLELDRRKIEGSIGTLNKELETLVVQRQNQRKRRAKTGVPVVALVGYTNAGKSTIMNALVDMFGEAPEKKVFEKDMLFATLETSVRNIRLPDNRNFLLTDTVGFISKLPHQLVKAFRSTLEEVREADILIHVVDFSNPNYKQQIEVTEETLREIGVEDIPVIYAYNKIDMVEGKIPEEENDCLYVSAREKTGIDALIDKIRQRAFREQINCEMLIPYERGSVASYLNDNANIKSTSYEGEGILLSLECSRADYERYQEYAY